MCVLSLLGNGSVARKLLCKHVPSVTNKRVRIEELVGLSFSMRSVSKSETLQEVILIIPLTASVV
jgi:hypothetical protein